MRIVASHAMRARAQRRNRVTFLFLIWNVFAVVSGASIAYFRLSLVRHRCPVRKPSPLRRETATAAGSGNQAVKPVQGDYDYIVVGAGSVSGDKLAADGNERGVSDRRRARRRARMSR